MNIAVIIGRDGKEIFRVVAPNAQESDLPKVVHQAVEKFHHDNPQQSLLEGNIHIRFEVV